MFHSSVKHFPHKQKNKDNNDNIQWIYETKEVFHNQVDTQGMASLFVPCRQPDKLFNWLFVTVSLIKATIMLRPRASIQTYFPVLLCSPFYKTGLFQLQITSRLLRICCWSSLPCWAFFTSSLSCVSCHLMTDFIDKATWSWSRSRFQKCFITASSAVERCVSSGDCLPWDCCLWEDLGCINNESVCLSLCLSFCLSVCLSVWAVQFYQHNFCQNLINDLCTKTLCHICPNGFSDFFQLL